MDKLYIFPYSGSGLEVLDCLDDISNVIFVSDNPEHIGQSFHGVPVISGEELQKTDPSRLITVHGSAASYQNRLELIQRFGKNVSWETIIHPSAVISKYASIGKNVFISAGVSIGPNVVVDDHAIILANATIHHDSHIGTGSIICGNVLVAGNVEIESQVYIGAGSSIKNGITIGSGSLIGMGSIVLNSVGTAEVWFGNPAKRK
ncbi:NeuD/PglB/VioB family sugar acetyltransferase [Fluviicola sp.]|uniref:NeuD/PglB/VioB family sugar acetyltransferase n=1 Tax=Fluviicola sp. TaxID=1917219 RepID=UPI002629BFDF|nr:NeuD/PglB/VioB family sugar acetyltransferase [Fluviicola sp.]